MAKKDYYSILGVNRNASEQEIRQAYRRLARKYHPDVNPGDNSAEAKFKEINTAYEVLSDKENRQKYDQFGDQWQYADQFAKAGWQQTPFWDFSRSGGSTTFHFAQGDVDSILEDLFKGFGTRTARQEVYPRRGQDIEYPIEITLEEAYNGTNRIISFASGERLEVGVPAGVNNGSRIRVAGKGMPGHGGAKGDLYLTTSVKPHPLFERRGNNLYVEVAVPLTVAVLGGEVQVPTPKGKLMLKVPPETQNGHTFRLTGQGMSQLGDTTRGNLIAKVKIVLPTNLSPQEKELFKQLSQFRHN